MASGGGDVDPAVARDVDLDFWRNEDPSERYFDGLTRRITELNAEFHRLRTIRQSGGSYVYPRAAIAEAAEIHAEVEKQKTAVAECEAILARMREEEEEEAVASGIPLRQGG